MGWMSRVGEIFSFCDLFVLANFQWLGLNMKYEENITFISLLKNMKREFDELVHNDETQMVSLSEVKIKPDTLMWEAV